MTWQNRTSIAPNAMKICAISAKKSANATNTYPAQLLVIEDACQKYACTCAVKTAGKPVQPIEKSTAGASLLAHVIVSKVADHLPIHRQVKMMRRFGTEIADQTMCDWMRQSAELLVPLYGRLKKFVLGSKVVGTDDTPVKVLDRQLPHARKGRIWPYVGDHDHPAVIYDYTPTRERAGPERFLENYRGYLQADAYVAYDSFVTNPDRGMIEVGCWAHARRHVYKARETDPARMGAVLVYIAQLYAVEKRARRCGIQGETLRLLRQQASKPVLDRLETYLLKISDQLLPKSDAGQAVSYVQKNWKALTRYLEDGDLPIDNNHTERSLRGLAIGRTTGRSLVVTARRKDHGDSAKLCGLLRTAEAGSLRMVPRCSCPHPHAFYSATRSITSARLGRSPGVIARSPSTASSPQPSRAVFM